MSTVLLQATLDMLRAAFTPREVPTIQPYGGEFSAAEIDQLSFSCPAILVAPLGWTSGASDGRLQSKHARQVRMAAFVVTKAVSRPERMQQAMALAGRVCVLLRNWRPADDATFDLAGLEDSPGAENLYGRAVDAKGLALWLVDWTQGVAPKPGADAELFDLVRVDIEDTTQPGQIPPAATTNPTGLTVTERVDFRTPI